MFCFRCQKCSSNQSMHLKSNIVTPSNVPSIHQKYPIQTHSPSYSNLADNLTVPIQFYPSNIYESGVTDRLNNLFTDDLDSLKYYNIPHPPGFILTQVQNHPTPPSVLQYKEAIDGFNSPPMYSQIVQPTAPSVTIEYPKLKMSD
uniref:Ovule protein n=1 Tax=Heterorhabditis bacteriophora TaxID=37862 RepID=A0A1I7WDX8_HETBA